MALSKTTQDRDEIREWAEKRGGKPAEVASTERGGEAGIIRLMFPETSQANDSALKEISWEEFFEKFDASGLALVYQEVTAEGAESNFNRLVHPENAKPAKKSAKKASGKSAEMKSAKSTGAATKTAKKTPAKTAGAKNAVAKKTSAKKAVAKKTAKKTPAKTAAAKKAVAKKAVAKKTAAKKAVAKKMAKKAAKKR